MFAKVELWVVALLAMFALIGLLFYGWFLRKSLEDPYANAASRLVVNLSEIPDQAMELYATGVEFNAEGHLVQRDSRKLDYGKHRGLSVDDPGFKDDGHLLVSAYDDALLNSKVYLYRLSDQAVLWEWKPNVEEIYELAPGLQERAANLPTLPFNPMHPYLLEDGRILFSCLNTGLLVMLKPDSTVDWLLDGGYHHSVMRLPDGNFILPVTLSYHDGRYQDDGYAVVTPEGKELERTSLVDILLDHGHEALLKGAGLWENEMIHLNDVEPIQQTDGFVEAGDLAISCRNISTVFLYRPSEDRIIWLKTGPWLNQHDVDYLGEGKFSVFNNNIVRWNEDHNGERINNIIVYDMATGEAEPAFEGVLRDHELHTPTQGLHRMLPNGDAFVELSDVGQMARLGPDGPRWRYVHSLEEDGVIGALHWSRYFHPGELDLNWLNGQITEPESTSGDSSHANP